MIAKNIRGSDFTGLINYLVLGRVLHPAATRISDNLLSEATAAREMSITAVRNRRCYQPVRHIILAWHEGEAPSIEQQHMCAEELLERLGVASHQSFRVVHLSDKNTGKASGDGRHYELHIALNAVGPDGRAPCATRDWATIERATAETAAAHNFRQIPGRFNGVDGHFTSLNGKARGLAAQTGVATVADELLADPDRIQALKNARRLSKEAGTWTELLRELDRQGLRLERGKDRGPKRVRGLIMVDKHCPAHRQKFSALDTPDLKWGETALVRDLGALPSDLSQTPEPEPQPASTASEPNKHAGQEQRAKPDDTAAMDFDKEVARRMRKERALLTDEFKAEQQKIKADHLRIKEIRKSAWSVFQARRAELLEASRIRRRVLYQLFRRHPLLRKSLNLLFDANRDAKLRKAHRSFEDQKATKLPSFLRFTTWSVERLKEARSRVERELRAEINARVAEKERVRQQEEVRAAQQLARVMAENVAATRKAFDSIGSKVRICWNSQARTRETVASQHLIWALKEGGVQIDNTSLSREEVGYVEVRTMAEWIGLVPGETRTERLAQIERAGVASLHEAATLEAERDAAAAEIERRKTEKIKFERRETHRWVEAWVAGAPRQSGTPNQVTWMRATANQSSRLCQTLRNASCDQFTEQALENGGWELSVAEVDLRAMLTRIPLEKRQAWDDFAECLLQENEKNYQAAEQARQARQARQAEIWAKDWVGQAPRSQSAFGKVAWVMRDNPGDQQALSQLQDFLKANLGERCVVRPLATGWNEVSAYASDLVSMLMKVNAEHRDVWDRYGTRSSKASNANQKVAEQARLLEEAETWGKNQLEKAPRKPGIPTTVAWIMPETSNSPKEEFYWLERRMKLLLRDGLVEHSIAKGWREVSVSASDLLNALLLIRPDQRDTWDEKSACCRRESVANRPTAIEASLREQAAAWRKEWLDQAPRKPGSSNTVAWVTDESTPYGTALATLQIILDYELGGKLTVHSIAPGWSEISVLTTDLSFVLEGQDPSERGNWNDLRLRCHRESSRNQEAMTQRQAEEWATKILTRLPCPKGNKARTVWPLLSPSVEHPSWMDPLMKRLEVFASAEVRPEPYECRRVTVERSELLLFLKQVQPSERPVWGKMATACSKIINHWDGYRPISEAPKPPMASSMGTSSAHPQRGPSRSRANMIITKDDGHGF